MVHFFVKRIWMSLIKSLTRVQILKLTGKKSFLGRETSGCAPGVLLLNYFLNYKLFIKANDCIFTNCSLLRCTLSFFMFLSVSYILIS